MSIENAALTGDSAHVYVYISRKYMYMSYINNRKRAEEREREKSIEREDELKRESELNSSFVSNEKKVLLSSF